MIPLSEQNITDIENSILILITNSDIKDIEVYYSGYKNMTFASVSWIDYNDQIHVRHGIAIKKKGDIYNRHTGQLIALIDILKQSRVNNSQIQSEFDRLKGFIIKEYPDELIKNDTVSIVDIAIGLLQRNKNE